MMKPIAALLLLGTPMLAACSQQESPPSNQSSTSADEHAIANEGGVIRDVAEPEQPPVQTMPAATVIQSQPGPDGSQVDLLKAAVTGDILTVTLRCSSTDKINSESFRVSDISVIDDATSQRIAVLKDNDGRWMASNVNGDNIGASCETKPGIIWAKFPAPPATSKTISINLPEVAPFDGVPVAR
jgi:hypothetical protein